MIKRFVGYYKPYKLLFAVDMLAAIVIAVCNLYYPTLAKDIINVYSHDDTPRRVILFSALLLGIYLIKSLCTYIVSYYGHVMGIKLQQDMRRDLFKKYESLPTSYYDDHKTGDLLSRLVNDLFEVSELAHHGPENLFLILLMLIGSFVMLIRINVTLTLIMFAFLPFIVLLAVLSRRGMKSAMKKSRQQTSVINSTLENSISGIRETKSYCAEHYEMERFGVANRLFATYRGQAMKAMGRYETVMGFIGDFLYLAIIFIGGLFLLSGKIDTGEFAAFILYIGMFLTPVQKFVAIFEQLQEGMTGFSRFCEIMDEPEEIDEGRVQLESVVGDIRFENVGFSYGDTDGVRVIDGLSLDVKAGKTLALVGPSGGGKTTLCNLIPRFYEISEGRITLDGIDIRDIRLASLRSHIGIVSQSIFLFDGTVRDNIAYARPDATDEEIVEAAKRASIHEFIITLKDGYLTEVGERGVKLSGGQRQRISIARAFLKNPSLLILDEATSALDNVTEMQIQKSLEELSSGRTVIVVAHRLSTVKGADEIVVLDKNGIIERGTHEELLALGGEYSHLYSYQFKAYS
ncbi:MAG: ABC transporter ATP-binding protein [Clostridia bacterium]|nr:ABC transporter ATP-binding protein [Clostridia bacterium]